MKKLFPILISLLISTILRSQSQEIKSVDSLINLCHLNNCFNGDILVTKNDISFYKKTVGYRDNEFKEELKPNSLFNIASVSKPFTSVAILQLQDKKLLNINDRVKKHIPLFPYDNVCIKHLLSHTSGLIPNIDFLDEIDQQIKISNDSIINLLIKYNVKLEFEPGADWSYSNLGYDILAIIVEQVTKMKFDIYMEKYIFRPAGMSRTFVPRTAKVTNWLPKNLTEKDLALPHNFEDYTSCNLRNIYPNVINSKAYFYGAGDLYSTVSDLSKFDKALTNNKILSKESQALAYTPFQLNNGGFVIDSLAPILSYYGLGWEISIDTIWGKTVWHKGRSGGTRAVFLRNIDKKQMVSFLDNNDNWNTDLKAVAFLKIINHQAFKNPLKKSLIQQFGCDISSNGFENAYHNFLVLKETKSQNYFISYNEMIELAKLLDNKNNLKDALSVSKLCNELNPNDWDALLTYGNLLLKNKQSEKAISYYKNAVSVISTNEEEQISLLGAIGSQFIDANRFYDAEIVLKLNTEIFPNDCNSFDNYAFILEKNNKLDLAMTVQEKAVALATEQKHKLLKTLQENLDKLKMKNK